MDRTAPAPAAPLLDHANPTARRVDAALVASEHRGMSVAQVARRVRLPREDAARLLDRLVASGHAERIGAGAWTRYRATDPEPTPFEARTSDVCPGIESGGPCACDD